MREYINEEVHIDGRKIPYPIYTVDEYIQMHDGINKEEMENWIEENQEISKKVNQILAIKQSCFLLRNTTHSCQSLSDDLYDLKLRLIVELKEIYGYEFDDDWVEEQLGPQEKCAW